MSSRLRNPLAGIALLCLTLAPELTSAVPEQSNQTLFRKISANPLFDIGNGVPGWRSVHVANVSILKPAENPSEKWLLYCRGSGRNQDGYHDTIGLFAQSAADFNPLGPWIEYKANPVLSYGPKGSHDEMHLLDTAAVRGKDGKIIIYYKSRDYDGNIGLCAAVSTNGRSFEKLKKPILRDAGICDVVYHNSRYYLFRGDMAKPKTRRQNIWILRIGLNISDRFDKFHSAPEHIAIQVGGSNAYDSRCVYGAKIFRVTGDPRWFMIYQTSGRYIDYPDRFHAAWSPDLIHWTKVKNDQPLLRHGDPGEWDQGGIWTGSVIEHAGKLYVFYEGWGSFGTVPNRNKRYYKGGHSRVGVASATVAGFLSWVDGKPAE